MTDRRPIDAEIQGTGEANGGTAGADPPGPVPEETFKDALSYHAAGVNIVAIRDDGDVHATTVSSFIPVSAAPPTVLVSVGGNARVLPFLDEDVAFVVNVLAADQRKLASVFADSYPVGPSPFPDTGEPVIPGALASLLCRVGSRIETETGLLVLGRVEDVRIGGGDGALVHYRRGYHTVRGDEG